jgi:hypothetical protein
VGCETSADCDSGLACSPTHACTSACTGSGQCNGGCCDDAQCQPGTTAAACGQDGAACVQCAPTVAPVCGSTGTCGPCVTASDCPLFQACQGGTCSQDCDLLTGHPCNGGCCELGRCQNGTALEGCETSGGACHPCNVCQPICLPVDGGGVCGCQTFADCNPHVDASCAAPGRTCHHDAGSPGKCL